MLSLPHVLLFVNPYFSFNPCLISSILYSLNPRTRNPLVTISYIITHNLFIRYQLHPLTSPYLVL